MTWAERLLRALTDGAAWTAADGYLHRMLEHLGISLLAVAVAAAVALPMGIWVGHRGSGSGWVGAVTGAARAIPTLGLLTILGLALGIGLEAPLIALTVLAVPSLLAGAYAGVESVSGDVVDAARASGYTERQIITRVELPLSAGVIVGGVRSALLQVVATATLAAYITDIGLGGYIFAGLKTRDYTDMLLGSVLVVILAVFCELVMAVVQRRLSRATRREHSSNNVLTT